MRIDGRGPLEASPKVFTYFTEWMLSRIDKPFLKFTIGYSAAEFLPSAVQMRG